MIKLTADIEMDNINRDFVMKVQLLPRITSVCVQDAISFIPVLSIMCTILNDHIQPLLQAYNEKHPEDTLIS